MIRAAIISLCALALTACEDTARDAEVTRGAVPAAKPVYKGVETQLLDGDLVSFQIALDGTNDPDAVNAYAECAAAQYALIRGYGFARHVRTNVTEQGGLWRADAVYTISPTLPRGLKTIDAEVVTSHCAENGIPTV